MSSRDRTFAETLCPTLVFRRTPTPEQLPRLQEVDGWLIAGEEIAEEKYAILTDNRDLMADSVVGGAITAGIAFVIMYVASFLF